MIELWIAAAVVFAAFVFSSVRVLKEYERAVIFRLGKARGELAGPGLVLMLPLGIDRATTVDTRTDVVNIPPQEVITSDNISIMVDAIVYMKVDSPKHAVLTVQRWKDSTCRLAATTLRAVIGRMELDEILAHREQINDEVRTILDERTDQWGVDISAVELKDIELPQEMKRAMARQAEAERERRAKIISAEGELQAAEKLGLAARRMSEDPAALQLRLYQTLVEISSEQGSKIVVPVPIELLAGHKNAQPDMAQITQLIQTAVQQLGEGGASAKPLSTAAKAQASALGAPSISAAKQLGSASDKSRG